MRRLILLALLLGACAAEETALPPLVAVPDEPPAPAREPDEPPPVAEHDVGRCERVLQLRKQGFEALSQKRYDEAKKHYLRAIELDPSDTDAPAQLARIDKLTENAYGSDTAIAHAQSMGAARSPCEPGQPVAKQPPPKREAATPVASVEVPYNPSMHTSTGAAPPIPTPSGSATPTPVQESRTQPDVRQDGTPIVTAKDQKAAKQLPSASEVQRVLAKEDIDIVGCYTKALGRDPSLAGKATFQLTIDKDGKVAEMKTSDSSLYDASLDLCVTTALKRVVLGKKAPGQIEIWYALNFSPKPLPKAHDQRSLLRQ